MTLQQHRPLLPYGKTLGWLAASMPPGSYGTGLSGQALQRRPEALTLAQALSHPYSLAYGLVLCCLPPSVAAGSGRRPKRRPSSHLALATEHGFPHWVAMGTILHGWALAEQGQGRRALPRSARA